MDDDLDERQTVDGVAVLSTTADAVSASVACARALGLPADDPEVIAEGYSVRVRLRPAPVVTRVVTVGRALRPHPLPWLEREVLVAQFLAASGVPIVAPWEDPGPHIAEGLEVCLWHWTEHDSREVSAAGFGAMLGPLHDALARYPGDLPTLIGPLTDISPALAISSDPTPHRAAAELVPLTRSWPARPLHGDAHTGNVLMTPDGPLWTDFRGRVCRARGVGHGLDDDHRRRIGRLPRPIDRTRLSDCRDLRRLQVLAGLLVGNHDDPSLYETLVAHLDRRLHD